VEGNGNGKKKRRKRIIWISIAATVVVLVVAVALIASTGGTKIDPRSSPKSRRETSRKAWWPRQDRAHHQGRDQIQGQRIVKKLYVDTATK